MVCHTSIYYYCQSGMLYGHNLTNSHSITQKKQKVPKILMKKLLCWVEPGGEMHYNLVYRSWYLLPREFLKILVNGHIKAKGVEAMWQLREHRPQVKSIHGLRIG